MMTKQDFQLIADCISESHLPDAARLRLIAAFVVRLRANNARFDEDRFRAAIKR